MSTNSRAVTALMVASIILPGAATAQGAEGAGMMTMTQDHAAHQMATVRFGGWRLAGMAQGYAIGSTGQDWGDPTPLGENAVNLTQPAVMATLSSPGGIVSLRTTLNFEGWTQPNGELTYGSWGEGFLDRRHPHTLVHEAMLTARFPNVPGGSFSLSAGKGFAPYGTEDPMGRPTAKFPTNHHLSQIVERFTAIAAYRHRGGTSLEVGVFGGSEPKGVYDFSNISDFGNSFSARLTQRTGAARGGEAPWALSASYARVTERHHDVPAVTHLTNLSVRHEQGYGIGHLVALAEASNASASEGQRYWSLLGEARLDLGTSGRHQTYVRTEYSTRPEYQRAGLAGTPGFFRYDHDHAVTVGATRWAVQTVGYGVTLGGFPAAAMPFIEVQRFDVRRERGEIDPSSWFGRDGFFAATVGVRLFLGGGQMRMGSYGVVELGGVGRSAGHGTIAPATQGGAHAHH